MNKVGRRVDQTTPLADARLQDGSRVNVIIPPLSLKGTAISIRKFSEKPITLDMMRGFGSMSEKMATALKNAGAEVETHELQGMGHDMQAMWAGQTPQWVAAFFRRHLIGEPATRPAPKP